MYVGSVLEKARPFLLVFCHVLEKELRNLSTSEKSKEMSPQTWGNWVKMMSAVWNDERWEAGDPFPAQPRDEDGPAAPSEI